MQIEDDETMNRLSLSTLIVTKNEEGNNEACFESVKRTTGDWILILEADERVSPDLVNEFHERLNS